MSRLHLLGVDGIDSYCQSDGEGCICSLSHYMIRCLAHEVAWRSSSPRVWAWEDGMKSEIL